MEEQLTADEANVVETQGERVAELEQTLREAREALDASERRREIDVALLREEAVDLETARMLTEAAVEQMDEPDVALAVRELRQRKAFLFRRGSANGGAAMSGHGPGDATGASVVAEAASAAAATGDRGALLRYLRARRGVA
jgi:molybdopterin converting factor small subunit